MAKSAAAEDGGARPKGRAVLQSFDYEHVRLLPSRFLAQVEQARELYGRSPTTTSSRAFAAQAGLPAPGEDMKGWCKASSAVIFGQLLSGMVRLGRATGDRALIDKAIALYEGWSQTLAPTAMRGCGPTIGTSSSAASSTSQIRRCDIGPVHARADRRRGRRGPSTARESPPMATISGARARATRRNGTRCRKPLPRLSPFRRPAVQGFGDVWLYEDYWRGFADRRSRRKFFPSTPTATSTPSRAPPRPISSPATARYLKICINAYDFVLRTQCYATGGYGPDERLMPPDGSLGRSLDLYGYHAEIPCGSWAGFKLSMYLMRLHRRGALRRLDRDDPLQRHGREPAAGAGRQVLLLRRLPRLRRDEDLLLARMAVLLGHLHPEHGRVPQHDLPQGRGRPVRQPLRPLRGRWKHDGQTVSLRQETDYPESETSTMTLDARAAGDRSRCTSAFPAGRRARRSPSTETPVVAAAASPANGRRSSANGARATA